MTQIAQYIAPHTQKINGSPRDEHHFWLSMSEHDEHTEVANWITHSFEPQCYQYWPETVPVSFNQSVVQFHVILHKDRDAMLFRLRW